MQIYVARSSMQLDVMQSHPLCRMHVVWWLLVHCDFDGSESVDGEGVERREKEGEKKREDEGDKRGWKKDITCNGPLSSDIHCKNHLVKMTMS